MLWFHGLVYSEILLLHSRTIILFKLFTLKYFISSLSLPSRLAAF